MSAPEEYEVGFEPEVIESDLYASHVNTLPVPGGAIYEAIHTFEGSLTKICAHLNLRRKTLTDRINKSPALKEALEEYREQMVDKAEENLSDFLKAGDAGMTRFTLQTLGKDRGYHASGVNKDGQVEVVIRTLSGRDE